MLTVLRWVVLLALGSAPALASSALGPQVAEVARVYRDTRPKLSLETCNGLVQDILRDAGAPLTGNVRMLYAEMRDRGWVHRRKAPLVGDIVFFDHTYDSNRNGKQDDPLSHIAVVISVDPDGTVHMVHHGSKGIRPLTMNLHHPSKRHDASGKPINSWLGAPGYAKEGRRLSGELWAAFATPHPKGSPQKVSTPTTASRAPISSTVLPVGLQDPALRRVWEGERLAPRHLRSRTCTELWFLRNAVFASHGYAFQNQQARAMFHQISTYAEDPAINGTTVQPRLTRRDRKNLDRLVEAEREAGCGN